MARTRIGAAVGAIGMAALGATIVAPPPPLLIWNTSASAPLGLYAIAPGRTPVRGEMVAARLPGAARMLAVERGYLPWSVPAMKLVAAVAGDRICAIGASIAINGMTIARRRPADRRGRPLPAWHGCVRLRSGEVFLLNGDVPDSFDGRYFGVSEDSQIVGTARLIWRA